MRAVFTDERISEKCERALVLRGFTPIKMPPCKRLEGAIASHPDMLLAYHGGVLISSAEYCEAAPYVFTDAYELSPELKLRFCDEVQGERYPYDAIFNVLIMGKFLFCRKESVARAVLEYADEAGLEVIDVRQGYPACTVLALDAKHAITADRGMMRALECCGIKVTLIREGGIALPPYEYGFIGGAAGVCDGVVYFLGAAERHPDWDAIYTACNEAEVVPVSLSDEDLGDFGRLIFL